MEKKQLPKKARKEIKKAMITLWCANAPGINVSVDTVGQKTLYHLYYTINRNDCELHNLGPEFEGQQIKLCINRVEVKTAKRQPAIVT